MKIFGIGTDIVNIKRIDKILKKKNSNFKNRIFSSREIIYCDNKKILVHTMQKDLRLKRPSLKL